MAITTQFLTGFEHGVATAAISVGTGGLISSGTNLAAFTTSTSSPRNGSYCCHLVAPASTVTNMGFLAPGNPTKIVIRFGLKVPVRPPSVIEHVLSLQNSASANIFQCRVGSTGVLGLIVSGTTVIGATIDTTSWHLIEIQLDTVAKTCDWKVDGVAQTRATSAGTLTDVRTVLLGNITTANSGVTADYDDLIFGTWTDPATDWYGDGKTLAQPAGVDGTHATITSLSPGDAGTAYSGTPTTVNTVVDDPPGTLGWTATRSTTDNIALRTATVGAYAEIKPAPTTETGQANSVRALLSYSSATATANRAACDVRNSAGAVTELWGLTGGVGQPYNTIANVFKGGLVTPPAAGWTAAEVNAIRFRFGGCTSADINPVPTVQALMLEVDWPVSVPAGTPWTAAPGDTITIGDSIDLVTGKTVAVNDPLTAADVCVGVATFDRTVADPLTIAELLTPVRSVDQPLADIMTSADVALQVTGKDVALADTAAIVDTSRFDVGKAFADTLTAADASWRDATKLLADTMTVADQATTASGVNRALADMLVVVDLAAPLVILERSLADTLAVADQLAFLRTAALAFPEALTIADLTSPLVGGGAPHSVPLADVLAVADNLARIATYARSAIDTLTITDLLTPVTGGGTIHSLPLVDLLTIADTSSRLATLARNFDDPVTIADALTQRWDKTFASAELLLVTDLLSPRHDARREFADMLVIADLIAAIRGTSILLRLRTSDGPLTHGLLADNLITRMLLEDLAATNATVTAQPAGHSRLADHPLTRTSITP